MAILCHFFQLTIILIISQLTNSIDSPPVKNHADGSISSNSGHVSFFEQWRKKRDYFMDTNSIGEVENGISQEDAQIIVDEHNRYRKTVSSSNMQKINWDPQLAADAQTHANRCYFGHSTNRINTGESIWATPVLSDSVGKLAVKWWYDEVYQCGCGNGYTQCCAHYSQLVWAETNRIGCGFAICPSITNAPGQRYFFVCRYAPAGNRLMYNRGQMISQQAYCVGSACAACPGKTTCDGGLCS